MGQVRSSRKKRPSRPGRRQRQPVAPAGRSPETRLRREPLDRSRILQQNGVGGGGQLVGQHEQGDGAGVGHRPTEQVR
jgi:hypothetical protein